VAGTHADEDGAAMKHAIVLFCVCPTCKREQPQEGFTAGDLLRLIRRRLPLEAYCRRCDGFWSVSIHEPVHRTEIVACVSESASPFNLTGNAASRMVH
jgi:hypothetical protein